MGSRVTATASRPTKASAGPRASRLTRWPDRCDALVDLAVVVLATWTVVYHVALVAGFGVTWAVVLEVIALAMAGLGWWRGLDRLDRPGSGLDTLDQPKGLDTLDRPEGLDGLDRTAGLDGLDRPEGLDRAVLAGTAVAVAGAAVLFAVNGPWPVVVVLWLLAALGGTAWSVLQLRRAPLGRQEGQGSDSVLVCLAWATALAVLSTFTLRPNPDDLYYVNLAQWVADRGTFPLRDTIFSDQSYPMSSWPPIASYDALTGTVARLVDAHAATVVYVGVPPVATFLTVLALWRLLRTWRVPLVPVALSVALAFLLLDAGPGYATPGNLFLTRLWQGKVILLCLVVPALLVYAVRYVERPTRARAVWLFAGGTAAVGLTTSAMFLVPLVAVAGTAPLLLRAPWRALVGFVAMAAYPVAAGVLTVVVGGRSADDFASRRLYRFDPAWFGHQIFQDGVIALVAVTAVLAAALLIPHRGARLTTALLALFTGVTFVPGVTEVSYDLLGLGPTLWRVSWLVTVGALVGVLGASLASWRRLRALRFAAPVALVGALVLAGVPIWSEEAGVSLRRPPHWQRSSESVRAANLVVSRLEPGDLVLAPPELAITIDVMTTRVKTVAPRKYFMDYLSDVPRFRYEERATAMDFVDPPPGSVPVSRAEAVRALDTIDVEQVCVRADSGVRLGFLRAEGFEPSVRTYRFTCVGR